jgi:transcription initiation factor TFIID TATA-box-binding protein
MPKITNIVCTSDIGRRIDLKRLTRTNRNIRYDPGTFSGVIWKHPRIGGNCLTFSNGKICVNGAARSRSEARKRLRRYARLVQKQGWPFIRIVTMSASYRADANLSMEALVRDMGASFEPELFPAAMLKRDGVHFTCFRKGHILVTGIRSERTIERVVMPTLIEIELFGGVMFTCIH